MRFRAGATILARRTDENQCQPVWNTEAACHQVFYLECYLILPLLAPSFSKLFWDALGRFLYQDLVRSSPAAGGSFFSPHLCVGFLFLVLYPARPPASARSLSHTALSHTTLSHTHTLLIFYEFGTSMMILLCARLAGILGPPSLRNRWNQCYCWGKDPMCQLPILEF